MARFAIALLALSAAACSGKDPYNPGEPIGEFHVTAKLVSSTCGQTPNPWEFDVKLRHDQSTLFWVQGGAPANGHVDPRARATITSTASQTLRDADPKTGLPACVVSRADALDVTLASGGAPASDLKTATAFAGSLTYTFTPGQGSDCSDQLLSTSGDYESLPCAIHYELSGQRTKDLPK